MKFHHRDNSCILILSDLHLGAGRLISNRKNCLEDFHYDKELVEFINYHSKLAKETSPVEIIINGDFFDLLAVPFVPFFDDEFWSEQAALSKLEMIINAHQEVIHAIQLFLRHPYTKLTYILGNHDAEIILPALQARVRTLFETGDHSFQLLLNDQETYQPLPKIVVKHGHEFEVAHHFNRDSMIKDAHGRYFFIPPWGSYYVSRIINKFKEERDYINAVRPINKFIINGLIYDTLFTLRFGFMNFTYFFMVRFLMIFKQNKKLSEVVKNVKKEMHLFQDYESLTENDLINNQAVKALIVGHTHDPIFREYDNGNIFINTGTWTKMYNLDFGKNFQGARLTYARIDVKDYAKEKYLIQLNEWKGILENPYKEFHF